jgi:ATP-dependent helicase/nuclease subunit A
MLGAPSEEIDAAADAVSRALAHPVLRAAEAAGVDCRRETPLLLRMEDGSLIEGVVDLAYREAGVWVVVDYKTDIDIGARQATYEKQVALYAQAISRATGEPTRGILLHV